LDLGKTLKEFGPSGRMPLSAVAAFVGQKEVALDAIALEADLSVIDILGIIWTPVYQPLRSEPRFLEFLRKMPEYWPLPAGANFAGQKAITISSAPHLIPPSRTTVAIKTSDLWL
jgi:hypothetical protein